MDPLGSLSYTENPIHGSRNHPQTPTSPMVTFPIPWKPEINTERYMGFFQDSMGLGMAANPIELAQERGKASDG